MKHVVAKFPFPVQTVQSDGWTGASAPMRRSSTRWKNCPPIWAGWRPLLHWNQVYETVRPHQALGYKTPDQFYQDWLTAHPAGKEVSSDMS